MKIWSFTTVKDEADIIESFVRYHMNIFDGMVISDNCSNDNTLLILKKLQEEGYNIDILEDKSRYFDQNKKRAELLNHTKKKHKPDIIFPIDADEFVCCYDKKNPREYIEALDSNTLYKYKMINFVPTTNDTNDSFIPSRLVNIRTYKGKNFESFKSILPKGVFSLKGFEMFMGCHSAKTAECDELPFEISENLYLAHYPVRSKEQITNKIISGRLNNSSLHSRSEGLGFHQYEILDEIILNNELSDKTFYEIARTYGLLDKENVGKLELNPINLSFAKKIKNKYDKNSEIKMLSNVLKVSEAIIDHMREELKEKTNRLEFVEDSRNKYIEGNAALENEVKRLNEINKELDKNYNAVINSRFWKLRNKIVRIIKKK